MSSYTVMFLNLKEKKKTLYGLITQSATENYKNCLAEKSYFLKINYNKNFFEHN